MWDMDINETILQHFNEQNHRAIPEFEGLSPVQMNAMLYAPFSEGCPLRLKKMMPGRYAQIPMLQQVKYLAGIIERNGELPLTKAGNLPPKYVKELYGQGFIKDWLIETGIKKLVKETDAIAVELAGILLRAAGLTKVRKNVVSFTVRAHDVLGDDYTLLHRLLTAFGTRFNWGCFDGYADEQIGRIGFAFSLLLVLKYRNEAWTEQAYAEKYFAAFPAVREQAGMQDENAVCCYCLRTFSRFLEFFGLAHIDSEFEPFHEKSIVCGTELVPELFVLDEHAPGMELTYEG